MHNDSPNHMFHKTLLPCPPNHGQLLPQQIHSNGWIELVQKNGSSLSSAGVLVFPPEMTTDTIGHVFYRETTDPDLLSSMGKALEQLFPGFGNPIAMVVITYGSHSENKVRSIRQVDCACMIWL